MLLNKLKTYAYTKTCTAALLIKAQNWKQSRCPSKGEYKNHGTTDYSYYLVLRNELSSYNEDMGRTLIAYR